MEYAQRQGGIGSDPKVREIADRIVGVRDGRLAAWL
jgi:hypothetical protein